MSNAIRLDQKFCASDKFLTSRVDEELVMLNVEVGEYYGMNAVGSWIWEQFAEPVTAQEVIERMAQEFDVDLEVARTDVTDFVAGLVERELILPV